MPGAGEARPGDIAKARGLAGIRVGDRFGSGESDDAATAADFATPSLETVVHAADGDQTRLHAALVAMADQDPLIRTRALPGGESSVLLYGEVQKEVVAARLAEEYGVEAFFEPSRTVYLERPSGVGEYCEDMACHPSTRFRATLGFRVSPGAAGSGRVFRYETELGALPPVFHRATEETVLRALEQGLDGWEVTDVVVRTLPGLTRGEAVWLSQAAGDRPVRSRPAVRERTDGNPAELDRYLRHLALEKA